MSAACFKAWVYGRVQGVGFRYSTQAEARALGVLGYARNLEDGSVEVLAWGEAEKVGALIDWLKAGGPRSARVDSVRVEPHQPSSTPRGFTTG
ncbi:acylphosphatase [Pantoea anthophila]|uniref:acylphosphatase n=1 Tax=Pantoea anthophila TaxID=470931 RepID=UPI00254F3A8C|nr:acylphosphatase [Pantoea anthophila]WIM55513.1 acylphosphatase [Pantoea anthophila]